ncbi:hypothetical protein ACFE04_021006 [Oxalis oulophora]
MMHLLSDVFYAPDLSIIETFLEQSSNGLQTSFFVSTWSLWPSGCLGLLDVGGHIVYMLDQYDIKKDATIDDQAILDDIVNVIGSPNRHVIYCGVRVVCCSVHCTAPSTALPCVVRCPLRCSMHCPRCLLLVALHCRLPFLALSSLQSATLFTAAIQCHVLYAGNCIIHYVVDGGALPPLSLFVAGGRHEAKNGCNYDQLNFILKRHSMTRGDHKIPMTTKCFHHPKISIMVIISKISAPMVK